MSVVLRGPCGRGRGVVRAWRGHGLRGSCKHGCEAYGPRGACARAWVSSSCASSIYGGTHMSSGKGRDSKTIASQFCSLIRDNARFVVIAVCSAVFVMILEDVLELESMRLDRAAYWLIVEHLRRPWLTPIMESFSALATPLTLLVRQEGRGREVLPRAKSPDRPVSRPHCVNRPRRAQLTSQHFGRRRVGVVLLKPGRRASRGRHGLPVSGRG